MTAKELRITGQVHEVGYRLFLLNGAEDLLLERFVARNIVTAGKECVLVHVDGPPELVSRFVAFAESQYPSKAVVDSVEVRAYSGTVMSIDSFRQSYMVTQLTKLAQAGVSMLGKQDAMLGKQDAMLGKQDAMLGKQDAMLGKQDAMLGKQDAMLGKQDETIAVLKEEGEKTREVVQAEGNLTRDLMSTEGEKTREVVQAEGEQTRVVLKGTLAEDLVWVKDELIDIRTTLNRVKQKVGVE
jgi:acylphosphatase